MRRDVVVIGASAGGVEALQTVMAGLPADFPAAVAVVLHLPEAGASALPAILDRAGPLPAFQPVSGQPLLPGRVLVAPPDRHLLIADEHVLLDDGPRENGVRPSVDALFRSAARACGPRVIGVVLSGALDDGTAGVAAIGRAGGVIVVQDPADAPYPDMPRNAIAHTPDTLITHTGAIAPLLVELCAAEVAAEPCSSQPPVASAHLEPVEPADATAGEPDPRSKPSAESLFGTHALQLDGALWLALRSLEERAALARKLGERAAERNSAQLASRYADQCTEALRAAELIRELIEKGVAPAGGARD